MLRGEGRAGNRKRIRRLMREMGIAALGPKPCISKPAPGHKIFPAAWSGHRAAEPGLVRRHHLHPHRPRLPLPRRNQGLGEPGGAGVAADQHHGQLILHLCAGGGVGAVRPTGDLQHRPGQPIHQRCVHRDADRRRSAHLDGRPRPLDGQRVHRTAVALAQARGHLLEGLCRRARGAQRDCGVVCLLQRRVILPISLCH